MIAFESSTNPNDLHLTEITQLFFGQALSDRDEVGSPWRGNETRSSCRDSRAMLPKRVNHQNMLDERASA